MSFDAVAACCTVNSSSPLLRVEITCINCLCLSVALDQRPTKKSSSKRTHAPRGARPGAGMRYGASGCPRGRDVGPSKLRPAPAMFRDQRGHIRAPADNLEAVAHDLLISAHQILPLSPHFHEGGAA